MIRTQSHHPTHTPKQLDPLDRVASFLHDADPPADEVVALFARLPPGHGGKLLDRALHHGIDAVRHAPALLRALFEPLEDVPLWVDWEQLDHGGATLRRCSFGCVLVLGCCALPLAYRSAIGNKPLVFTEKLLQPARALRRLQETFYFFHETCRPGGLRPYAPGWRASIRVRLLHAQVRRVLKQTGRWKEEWGAPLNQLHLAGTNLLFSVGLLHFLRRLGFHFSAAECDSVMQLWRYSGHLLGVDPTLRCSTEAEGYRLWERMAALEGPPDRNSRELTRVLVEVAMPEMTSKILKEFLSDDDSLEEWRCRLARIYYGLSHSLLGSDHAAELHYPRTAWRHARLLLRGTIAGIELGRRLLPGGTAFATRLGEHCLDFLRSHKKHR